jgi:hypothetical protein
VATPRYLALVVVGVLVVGGAVAFGITQLAGDDTGGAGGDARPVTAGGDTEARDRGGGGDTGARDRGGGVKPARVTVAVLNGTTVPGLAATLSDEIASAGFKVGTIDNFTDQQLAESVVQYAPGHAREAAAVSRKVGISQREAVNPSSQQVAGDATVIVIVGADKAQ